MLKYILFLSLLILSTAQADEFDDEFSDEFDENIEEIDIKEVEKKPYYIIGNIEQKANFATHNKAPHNDFNSLKSSLYLESEYSLSDNHKFRVSAKGFYDFIYKINSNKNYTQEEIDEFESEAEIFDFYFQGKISSELDYKIGRQVVVWGRSDTIRITDILNPLDNRSPGIVDIEDLRLPVGMAKFDYYSANWNLSAIVIGETRYSKNPVYGSDFYPSNQPKPNEEIKQQLGYAFSFNANFSAWDMSLYASKTRSDTGHIEIDAGKALLTHEDIYMLGYAFNYIYDTLLFKSEAAYLDGLQYTTTQDKTFSRVDALVGVEYNGISETVIALEVANRHINNYDFSLESLSIPVLKNTTQTALRANSDFFNATLTANFLVSLFGQDMTEGGFSRLWCDYDLNDNISATLGYVDYMKGSTLFDIVDDNDMLFASVKYSF